MVSEDIDREHLELLLQASALLNSTLNLDEVLSELLTETLKIVGAQNGCILKLEHGLWSVVCSSTEDGQAPTFSNSILNRVLEENDTLCLLDAQQDSSFGPLSSVHATNLRSVLCTPLSWMGEIRGALYLDHRSTDGVFQEDQKKLVDALGQQASIALQNAALLEERERLHQSALTEAIDELAETQAQLFHAHELTGVFSQSLTEPLADAKDAVNDLGEAAPDALKPEFQELQERVQHLEFLTGKFFEFTRPDQSKWKPFPVEQVVDQTLDLRFSEEEAFKVVRSLEPVGVFGDRSAFSQALLKVLDNAEDALKDAPQPVLELKSYVDENDLGCVLVSDNGSGIKPEVMGRVFEPFFSTKGVDYRPGLGLPLARHVLDQQAEIIVKSEGGTQVLIRFLSRTPN